MEGLKYDSHRVLELSKMGLWLSQVERLALNQ